VRRGGARRGGGSGRGGGGGRSGRGSDYEGEDTAFFGARSIQTTKSNMSGSKSTNLHQSNPLTTSRKA